MSTLPTSKAVEAGYEAPPPFTTSPVDDEASLLAFVPPEKKESRPSDDVEALAPHDQPRWARAPSRKPLLRRLLDAALLLSLLAAGAFAFSVLAAHGSRLFGCHPARAPSPLSIYKSKLNTGALRSEMEVSPLYPVRRSYLWLPDWFVPTAHGVVPEPGPKDYVGGAGFVGHADVLVNATVVPGPWTAWDDLLDAPPRALVYAESRRGNIRMRVRSRPTNTSTHVYLTAGGAVRALLPPDFSGPFVLDHGEDVHPRFEGTLADRASVEREEQGWLAGWIHGEGDVEKERNGAEDRLVVHATAGSVVLGDA